ncbi:MAG TPA: DUF3078 domain-containing protein [Cytophagaceae bacterium]|jgi:hypothetical protein|nr:DUF3078 domain-containing protein [Cytophagaceae bacterium]
MKKIIITFAISLLFSTIIFGQDSTAVKKDTSYWHKGTTMAINLSQTSLTNWNAGGQNAIAYNVLSTSFINYEKGTLVYSNSLTMSFGQADLAQKGWRKTDDRLYYMSKLSHEKSKKFRYTIYLDFLSQFANGYNYVQSNANPKIDSAVLVSKFLSRAYSTLALGLEYTPFDGLAIDFSPVTMKTTVVGYQAFADKGNFGVRPEYIDKNSGKRVAGSNFLFEPGAMLDINLKKDVAKNISLKTKVNLFWAFIREKYNIDPTTNILESEHYVFYKNVDVMWDFSLVMKVTKYITANITTSLIYDDDIHVLRTKYANDPTNPHAYGPAIQFKQVLGLGIQAVFKSKFTN